MHLIRTFTFSLILLFQFSAVATASLPSFDVSGKKGKDGEDGHSYAGSSAYGTGADGADGGDAGQAKKGQDAGQIILEMNTPLENGTPAHGVVVLGGEIVPASERKGAIKNKVQIGESGYIYLKANGGDGGHGGDGGQGQGGAKGYDGRDADQYSNGTDGGPGGDGGDGGNATSGKDGGKGGKIVVRLNQDDTHLIMLVRHEEHGGAAGKAGQNGAGGRGGSGGDGGSSYTWTTTRYVTKTRSTTDADGNPTTETYTDTETDFHHNSGGSDGSSGRSGRSGNARVTDGNRGGDGSYQIEVVEPNGKTAIYTEPFDLRLNSFKIESENKDGIIEPGEKVELRDITITNVGGMPTPPNHAALVFVHSAGWVISNGIVLKIPKSLAPGEKITLKEILHFTVKDTVIHTPGERFRTTDTANPLSSMSVVKRYFEGFENPKNFEITFPVEITPITAIESMSPGTESKIYLRVKNISKKAFGKKSDLMREVALKIRLESGELKSENLTFKDLKDNPHSLGEGFLEALEKLGPGESFVVEGIVGVNAGVPYYTDANLRAELELGKINSPSERRAIQLRDFRIRVAQLYSKTKDSGILLITNHGTRRKEVETWKEILNQMGLAVDVWDLSLNGFLALGRELKNGSNLFKDFEGKTIILLNNEFESIEQNSDNSQAARGHYFLAKKEFFQAAAANGTHFYVVGGSAEDHKNLFNEYLLQTEGDKGNSFDTVKSFLENLTKTGHGSRSAEKVGDDILVGGAASDFLIPTDVIEINQTKVFGEPKSEFLEKTALKLQKKLEKIHPDRRYIVEHRFDPKTIKEGLFAKWDVGTLQVRQTLDQSIGSAVGIEGDGRTTHSKKFITSLENHLGLFMAMTFEQKLDLMNKLIRHDIEILDQEIWGKFDMAKPVMTLNTARALIDAILISVADEQRVLRKHRWRGHLSRRSLNEKLQIIKKLSEFEFSRVLDADKENVNNDPGELMVRLAGGIKFLLQSQNRWYDLTLFGRKDPMVTKESMRYYEQFLDHVFGSTNKKQVFQVAEKNTELGDRVLKEAIRARTLIEVRVEELKEQASNLASSTNLGKKDASMMIAMEPSTRQGLTIDTQTAELEARVLDVSKVSKLRRGEETRLKHRAALEDYKTASRAALQVQKTCEDALISEKKTAEEEEAVAEEEALREERLLKKRI